MLSKVSKCVYQYSARNQRGCGHGCELIQSTPFSNSLQIRICICVFPGISILRGISVAVVMVGLFITTEPQIWGLDEGDSGTKKESALSRILWPACFAIGFIPVGITNVICEKELKKGEVNTRLCYLPLSRWLFMLTISCVDYLSSDVTLYALKSSK
jgi:hypothetical protein